VTAKKCRWRIRATFNVAVNAGRAYAKVAQFGIEVTRSAARALRDVWS
jgi:hypothetical protein